MSRIVRASLSVDNSLFDRPGKIVVAIAYGNRSQFVRDLTGFGGRCDSIVLTGGAGSPAPPNDAGQWRRRPLRARSLLGCLAGAAPKDPPSASA